MKQRIYFFDTLKFWLMMFVIIHHCSVPYIVVNGEEWVKHLYCLIMPFTMSTFTMISGFFYKKRPISKLVKIYLIPCIAISALNIFLSKLSPVPFINNGPIFRIGYAMWYLWVLFIYNIFTPLVIKKVSPNSLLIISIVLALLTCNLPFFNAATLQASRLISHYPFFVIGIIMKEKDLLRYRGNKSVRIWALVLFILLYIGNFSLTTYTGSYNDIPAFDRQRSPHIEAYGLILCSLLSICLLLFVPNKEYKTTKLGRNTMSPYLLHMSIVFPICWTLGIPYMNSWHGLVIYMIVAPLLCLVLFSQKVNNLVNKIFRFS